MSNGAPALIVKTGSVDCLAEYTPTTVKASSLREGMVILDDLNTAAAIVDHRMKAARGTGAVKFMLEDLENGGWITHDFHANSSVTVAAR